jgi:hypothetical protein
MSTFSTPEMLFREGCFENGSTLLEVRRAYFSSPKFRNSIHEGYKEGKWLADFVETDGAQAFPSGHIRVVYVQRPDEIILRLGSCKYASEGGKRIPYDCPPDGWAVPADGLLFHPETGAAIATVNDKAKAVSENTCYIAKHQEQFAGWTIPEKWREDFEKKFPYQKFDPNVPTHEQLAEFITSYQRAPPKNMGLSAVWRDFRRRSSGPFFIDLWLNLEDGNSVSGTCVHSSE